MIGRQFAAPDHQWDCVDRVHKIIRLAKRAKKSFSLIEDSIGTKLIYRRSRLGMEVTDFSDLFEPPPLLIPFIFAMCFNDIV